MMSKQELIEFFMDRDILIDPELLSALDESATPETVYSMLRQRHPQTTSKEKEHEDRELTDADAPTETHQPSSLRYAVKIITSYEEQSQKREVQHFIEHFNKRYAVLERMLQQRQELQHLTNIKRVLNKRERETVSIIGMVVEKVVTKSGSTMLTVEDPTGQIKVMFSKNQPEVQQLTQEITEDDMIGIRGFSADKFMFANTIIFPDIPLTKELRKSPDDYYAVCMSDIHVGSKYFLEEKFERFLEWLNGNVGNEQQQEIASKVKYCFIVGDLVDGIGIYPGQEEELTIKDIYEQYAEFASYVKKIPKHIAVILCPGNHDAVRLAEPQPPVREFLPQLINEPNVFMVSNPSLVNIHASDVFPGFDVLLYHGTSFDFYVANVDIVRAQGGYERPDIIMKYLLKRRHLAPTHRSVSYIPMVTGDPLIIDPVPDFLMTGHIHRSSVANYRNVTVVSGSCFQDTTPFQVKVGHVPEPARVPVIHLQTRNVKLMKF